MLAWIASQIAYYELAAGLQGTDHRASLLAGGADYRDQFSIVRYHGSSPCAKVIQLGFPPLTHSATTGVPFATAPLSRRCADHTISWIALAAGRLTVPELAEAGELVAFETSNQAIDFRAEADTEFVLGSAARHPYEPALGYYSVHTSPASLQAGEQRIAEIKARLQKEGRL